SQSRSIGCAESHVMHGARALPREWQPRLNRHMQLSRSTAVAHLVAMYRALTIRRGIFAHLLHVHELGQHRVCRALLRHRDRDGTEPPDLVLWRNGALLPRVRCSCASIVHEAEPLTLMILEIEACTSIDEPSVALQQVCITQTSSPEVQRILAANAQACAGDRMGSTTLRSDRPIKERQIRSRRGLTVGVKEVIGAGIILVHGLLDEAQPQRLGVETLVAWCVGGNRRQMVDAAQ